MSFDHNTGEFRWKIKKRNMRQLGGIAGCIESNGYRVIGIDGNIYHAHRLVWLLVFGEWPPRDIDHKDQDRSNNRPENLRLANDSENQCNRGPAKNNTSGHKGVYWLRGKWMVLIQKNGHRYYKGIFDTYEMACSVQETAAKELHGEFADT